MVGVHFLFAWRLANSVALPMSHSLRIFLPRPRRTKSLIADGSNISVTIAVKMSPESMNTRLDTGYTFRN